VNKNKKISDTPAIRKRGVMHMNPDISLSGNQISKCIFRFYFFVIGPGKKIMSHSHGVVRSPDDPGIPEGNPDPWMECKPQILRTTGFSSDKIRKGLFQGLAKWVNRSHGRLEQYGSF
jgi:hypothetical protein